MFTGIVESTAEVIEILRKEKFQTHKIKMPQAMCDNLKLGASVAHNGCCLTITEIENSVVSFDLMQETLKITNLGLLKVGEHVNIERAARFGDEIGGHQMSGHIICMASITAIEKTANNCQIWFEIAAEYMPYVFTKGYIGIDGISLTIGDVKENSFCVNLIPETLSRTNISSRQIGDKANIEIDPQTQAIVDTVTRVMAEQNLKK